MTQIDTIHRGDQFWCLHRRLLRPQFGTVIALTTEPGKSIGLEFADPIGGHSCDGRGQDGYCLWVTPEHILTDAEFQYKKMALEEAEALQEPVFELEELNLRD